MIKPSQISILSTMSTLCVLGHLLSPPSWSFAHEFLFKLTYLPIVLSAIWFGRRRALQLTTLFCLVYTFHILIHLYHHSHGSISAFFLDLSLYFLIAWTTGYLSDKQKDQAENLAEAFSALKEKTSLLLEFEENSRRAEQLKTMGELAGTVAHEVRTPLSALQGAIEIIVSEKSNEATRKKYSALVYREIKRIDQVVNGFLNIGHDQSVSMESISLETVIQESSSLLTPMLKNKNVQFNVHISGHLEVIVEKRSFHQVIMNLVINASNAMHATGGKIKISTEFKDDQVRINIEDSGVGVPEEIKPRLFDAFATSRKEGSGLGLYLSRNIIRSFNGELELSSSTPGSTIFSIRLPGTLSDV